VDTETDARELCKAEPEQSTSLLQTIMVKCLPREMATIVATETQARELGKFPAEHRALVVIAIVDAAQTVTAAEIKRYLPPEATDQACRAIAGGGGPKVAQEYTILVGTVG